jgi:flagellin
LFKKNANFFKHYLRYVVSLCRVYIGSMKMISINTNYGGIFAAKAAQQSQSSVDQAMERLSTGKRINYAKDDAAGQAVATRLTAEIQGLAMASRNAADGQSLIDTADGALEETHQLLLRMREVAVQSANGTLAASDRTALDAEFQALSNEITRIADNTSWAGIDLLDGDQANGITFQVGPDAAQTITHSIPDTDATGLSINANTVLTVGAASAAITALDGAISTVSGERAQLGAISNRLDSTINNLNQIRVNLASSKGRIEDADFAQETGNLAKGQILQQAATAMLAQANASKQTVLTLVR